VAVRNLPGAEDTACFVCGRRLSDHKRRERQPLPIMLPTTRAEVAARRSAAGTLRRWFKCLERGGRS